MPLNLGFTSYPSTSELSPDVWAKLHKIPSQLSQRTVETPAKMDSYSKYHVLGIELQRLTHKSIICEVAFKIKWIVQT